MEVTNTQGAYSPDIVYGQLTSPFQPPAVHINAHTPYDKDEDNSAVTLKDFRGNVSSFKYAKEDDEAYSFGIETNFKPNSVDFGQEKPEFPPKSVKSFSASEVPSNKDIVQGAIKNGYSYDQALLVAKTQKAYSTSVGITNDPIGALNGRTFKTVPA